MFLDRSITFWVRVLPWLLGFGLFNNLAKAQSRVISSVSVSISLVQRLVISDTKILPEIRSQDLDRGWIELFGAVTLEVSSNVPWRVNVRSVRENLYLDPKVYKPVVDLGWRTEGDRFQPFSTEPTIIARGPAYVQKRVILIDYRLKLNWGDTPPGRWEFWPEFSIEPEGGTASR